MQIIFFGADASWKALQIKGFRRRNTCLLRAFSGHSEVRKLVIVTPTTRENAFRETSWWRMLLGLSRNDKVVDVPVFAFIPGQSWIPAIASLNRFLARWLIRRALSGSNRTNTVQWCYWPAGYQLARQIGLKGPLIFDADHNIIDDINLEPQARRETESLLDDCGRRCSLIISGARSMTRWFEKRGFRQHALLRNGVDPTRFQRLSKAEAAVEAIPYPRIAYVGTLSSWVDYKLLAKLAQKRLDWNFLIVGESYKINSLNDFQGIKNVIFLGPRAENQIPNFLRACDVGLSLYNVSHASWLDGDSMKIFEYLAAALPVVSTPYHASLQPDFAGLLEICEGVDEFEQAILKLLDQSEEQVADWNKRREQFLKANTWEIRANEAVALIQETCFDK
jgi:glycosyltransferase involved in cell wall biosynthesis